MRAFQELFSINPNLGTWKKWEWLIYFIAIPTTLILIYLLPPPLKQQLTLNLQNPTLLNIITNHYVHNTADHLLGNLLGYLLIAFTLFNIETNHRRLHIVTILFLTVLPVASSITMLKLYPINMNMFGFSGIVSAYAGYTVYAAYAYLKRRYDSVTLNQFMMILLTNYLILCLYNAYGILPTVASGFLLIIYIIVDREKIPQTIRQLINEPKRIPKNALIEFVYKLSLFIYTTIICFTLPSIIPLNFISGDIFVNVIVHYIGWNIGIFTPLIFHLLKQIILRSK